MNAKREAKKKAKELKRAAAEEKKRQKKALEEEQKARKRVAEKEKQSEPRDRQEISERLTLKEDATTAAAKEDTKGQPVPAGPVSRSVDITGRTPAQIADEIRQAAQALGTGSPFEIHVTGSVENAVGQLAISCPRGMTLCWDAAYAGSTEASASNPTERDAFVLLHAEDLGDDMDIDAPVFRLSDEGRIEDRTAGGLALCTRGTDRTPLDLHIEGGLIRGAQGDAVDTDGRVIQTGGQIEAIGEGGKNAVALRCGALEMTDGLLYARVLPSSVTGKGSGQEASFVVPFDPKSWDKGTGIALAWATEDGDLNVPNGAETGLIRWPEDAYAWWEEDTDGQTSICYGRGDNAGEIAIGAQLPPMQSAGMSITNEVQTVPILFTAKTEIGQRTVVLDIDWGWDLFLGPEGSERYDNRIAVAACALANEAYSPEAIQILLDTLGFEDPQLANYSALNETSAFTLASRRILDGKKTIFAVVNRGSHTIMDWKGNVVDETIQEAGYFADCAADVARALQQYVQTHGSSAPEDNLFLVTGHSLGGVVTDILAARDMDAWPARNVFAYTFAAPLAPPDIQNLQKRPIYNILNEKDIVTSIPPQLSYKRLGTDNYSFIPSDASSHTLADRFRFLSHMDITKLEQMNRSPLGFFKQPVQAIMWNHSLTTYMAYLLAGGPEDVKSKKSFLWQFLQNR